MRLVLNGEEHELPEGSTVSSLIERLGLPRERVAVEVNLQVVRRADHGAHVLREGDQVEVVTFVGGG